MHRTVTVVAPSKDVASDIQTVLTIEGNETSWYQLITANMLAEENWFVSCVLTEHAPGDTSTLEPFKPYFALCNELYVDTSVHYGMIHLKLEDALADFIALSQRGTEVFLMHLDDSEAAKNIADGFPGIEVVTE